MINPKQTRLNILERLLIPSARIEYETRKHTTEAERYKLKLEELQLEAEERYRNMLRMCADNTAYKGEGRCQA